MRNFVVASMRVVDRRAHMSHFIVTYIIYRAVFFSFFVVVFCAETETEGKKGKKDEKLVDGRRLSEPSFFGLNDNFMEKK